LNPVPLVATLVPVDNGLLVVRRGIQPGRGRLALRGGYINLGETWQE
jgi:ADP-ribose pyrophosphatase YjhB (NUDIX family)